MILPLGLPPWPLLPELRGFLLAAGLPPNRRLRLSRPLPRSALNIHQAESSAFCLRPRRRDDDVLLCQGHGAA